MSKKQRSSNLGFFGLLTILFIGLKLTGYIDWSWWLVTAPMWGGFIVMVLFFTLIAIIRNLKKYDLK